mmetsp:Transcript_61092/g.145545  ORF Transcript_61092/g.145545 Transcript_61092/m.145545 type:complete len:188 (+) Transcript_61092:89-652(+)
MQPPAAASAAPETLSDPHLEDLLHKQLITREKTRHRWADRNWSSGDMVMFSGMKTRPHLNGACGEILRRGDGEDGFVTVRVFDKDGAVGPRHLPKKWRTMSVHPGRLRPLWNNAWQIQGGSSPVIPVATTLLGTTGASSVGSRSSAVTRSTGRSSSVPSGSGSGSRSASAAGSFYSTSSAGGGLMMR